MTLHEIAEVAAGECCVACASYMTTVIEAALREVQATERARLRVELDAAWEAGHWSWPSTAEPTRREQREQYIAGRLAAIEQETPCPSTF